MRSEMPMYSAVRSDEPALRCSWALAEVRRLPSATSEEAATFRTFAARAAENAEGWRSQHPLQVKKLKDFSSTQVEESPHTSHDW